MTQTKSEPDKSVVLKELGALEIKDAEKGEVEAVIATFGVIDKDFDVILDTAIPNGAKVKMSSYGHDLMGSIFGGGSARPVGKGELFAEKNKAIFRGKLFLQTQGGRETFEILKEMGKDQEWSFGFRVTGSEVPDEDWRKRGARRILTKLDCFEVSPVLRGAGVGTRTLAVKEETAPKEETPSPDPAPADPPADSPPAEQQADGDQSTAPAEKQADGEKSAADDAAAIAKVEAEKLAAAELKTRTTEAVEDFRRIQRTHKRLGLI